MGDLAGVISSSSSSELGSLTQTGEDSTVGSKAGRMTANSDVVGAVVVCLLFCGGADVLASCILRLRSMVAS